MTSVYALIYVLLKKKRTTNSDDEPTADTKRKPKVSLPRNTSIYTLNSLLLQQKKAKSNRAVTSDDEDAAAEPQPRGKVSIP